MAKADATFTLEIEQGPNLRRFIWNMRAWSVIQVGAGFIGGILTSAAWSLFGS